ncbi:acetylornithine transaminase [Actinomycetaceae bacterium MB13-C1-2]|nr:acetylornithine transaminase [Actinomycetaceae bacterium MB13-C1-2]
MSASSEALPVEVQDGTVASDPSASLPSAFAGPRPAEFQRSLSSRYTDNFMNTFGPPQLALVKGEGVYVWDDSGKKYMDLLAGIAVNALGQAHPAIVDAVTKQASELGHISNFFTSPAQVALGEKLQQIFAESGYEDPIKVFLTNSGTEANEAALKLTRLHKPGGRVLALTHSFHGRTMGALSVTEKPTIREPFEPLPGNVQFVEPTAEALSEAFDDDVAGIFVEPIQGEAGVVPLPDGILQTIRGLCNKHDALLVVDEVQTGIGRTGRWLASQGVQADVVTLAKGFGGGFPIGACIGVGAAGAIFNPGSHGSTFAGNPVGSAASLATLNEVEKLLVPVVETGNWLRRQLETAGYVVRGEGLLLGIEVLDAPTLQRELLDAGFIVNAPNATTIRVAPPLVITKEELTPFVDYMSRCLG